MHIRVDDIVEVMVPDDRDKNTGKRLRAKVLRIDRDAGKLVVEGINSVWKHMKKSQKNPQGGRLSMEMPVHVSNIALQNAAGVASRVGMRATSDGGKERYFKKGGASAGLVTPSKAQRQANRKKKK